MKQVRTMLAVLSLLFAHAASAEDFIPATTLVQIGHGWNGEQFVLIVASGRSTCPGGTNEYAIRSTHGAYKDMVALAMTAFATGATILIRPDGTCIDNNRAAILELRLVR